MLLSAAWAAWSWRARRGWPARIDAIRAAGDPASIADLAPIEIPHAENAAVQLAAIAPQLRAFAQVHGDFIATAAGKDYEVRRNRGQPATAEQLAAMRAILEKYADTGAGLARAAAYERYASRLDYSLPHTPFLGVLIEVGSDARSAARLLRWRMEVAMLDGRAADAVEDGIVLLQLVRLYDSEPGSLSFLPTRALRGSAVEALYDALSAGPVPAELHAALDRELARQEDPQSFTRMLKTERALSISSMDEQLATGIPVWARIVGPYKSLQLGVLDYYDELLPAAPASWHVTYRQSEAARVFKTPTGHGVMADLLAPAIQRTYEAFHRDIAVTRSLRIANALRRFAEENGREANGLADLDLPKPATIDPFKGEPLKLKRIDEGWIVYSVMIDGQDDGGDFVNLKDIGVGPRRTPENQ